MLVLLCQMSQCHLTNQALADKFIQVPSTEKVLNSWLWTKQVALKAQTSLELETLDVMKEMNVVIGQHANQELLDQVPQ